MNNSQVWTLIYGNTQKYCYLPDTHKEFIQLVKEQFKIQEFQVECIPNKKSKQQQKIIITPTSEDNYRKIKKMEFSDRIMNIYDLKKSGINNLEPKFYQVFAKGNSCECCTEKDCELCQGNKLYYFNENDCFKIDEYLQESIKQKISSIQKCLLKRYQIKIMTPEDFLNYHIQQEKNVQKPNILYQTINENILQEPIKLYQQIKLEQSVQQVESYQIKLLDYPDELIPVHAGQECKIKITYQNIGAFDWPDNVQIRTVEGNFTINQKLFTLKVQEQKTQKLTFQIPKLIPAEYCLINKFFYSLKNSNNEKLQEFSFSPQFKLKVLVRPAIVQNEFSISSLTDEDEKNNILVANQAKQKLKEMGIQINEYETEIQTILAKSKHRKLDVNLLISLLLE